MTPERWQRIGSLFERALDLPTGERAAFLGYECANDPALEREVLALLEADASPHPDLDDEKSVLLNQQNPLFEEDEQLGPYRLLHPLGEGGMGTVYLAYREDVDQFAAIKFVRPGILSPQSIARFRYERRILARLSHTHIARFLDTGLTQRGLPYVIMEYVEGEPLDLYCDTHQLTIDDRLRLFQQAGHAVQYAHQNFIVHRDLKPSNILVTQDEAGQPLVKLLDFGIAKLLDEADEQPGLTRTGFRIMTPDYAAPEQVKGEPVSAATDVYSLGVVLYELLTGQRPYDLTNKTAFEAEQIILETQPEKPSQVVSQETTSTNPATRGTTTPNWQRTLQGDLDVICLKALRKDTERRYASAEAFVDDVKRYLAGLPVTAQPDRMGYRVSKFVKRNMALVSASVLIAVLILGYATTAVVQANRIAAQAEVIASERDKAEEISAFLMGLFEASNPNEALGDTLSALELLEQGHQQIAFLSDQPAVQLRMLEVIADVYIESAQYEEADSLIEVGLSLVNTNESPPLAEASLLHRRASILREERQLGEADSVIARVLSTRRALLPPDDPDLASSLSVAGSVARYLEEYERAETFFREALAIFQKREDVDKIASTLNSLGGLYQTQSRFEDAETYFREGLEIRREHLGSRHPHTAISINNVATALRSQTRFEEAEALYREAIGILRTIYGDRHPRVAYALNNLGGVIKEQARYDDARPFYEEAIQIFTEIHSEQHPATLNAMNNLAVLLIIQGTNLMEADSVYRNLLFHAGQLLPADHSFIGTLKNNLGFVQQDLNRWDEALRLHAEVYALRSEKYGHENPSTLLSLSNVGYANFRLQRFDTAETQMRQFIEQVDSTMLDIMKQHALAHQTLALILLSQGDLKSAETAALEAVRQTEAQYEPDHHWMNYAYALQGVVYCAQGRITEGRALIQANEAVVRENRDALDPLLPFFASCE